MIREDYIIGWIKRFVRMLAEIAGLLKADQHQAASQRIDFALRELLGIGPDAVVSLTEGELMARLTLGEASQLLHEKCLILASLLSHLGAATAAEGRATESQECYLKALHIMLGLHLRDEHLNLPEYAPKVEDLAAKLSASSVRTMAALILYYEQTRQFARAEDTLYDLLESAPGNSDLIELGLAFYERLLALDDETLAEGNLPRAEVQAALNELRNDQ